MVEEQRTVLREGNGLSTLDSLGSFVSIENARCPDHFDLPIQYFCLTCKRHCFCSECALLSHSNCEVLSLAEAFKSVSNMYLGKWISQLSTRSENLSVTFRKLLTDRRETWLLKLQELHNSASKCNLKVGENMSDISEKVGNWVKTSNEKVQLKSDEYRTKVGGFLDEYEQMSRRLREVRGLTGVSLLRFYNENWSSLRQVLAGDTPRDVELFVRNTPHELKAEISNVSSTLRQIVNVVNTLQDNIRNCHTIESYHS